MKQYPYNSPIILTDPIFLLFGGQNGNTSELQRRYAYMLAEEQVTEHLNSFLAPTIVTGTFFWRGENPIVLDYGHVLSIKAVAINSVDTQNDCGLTIVSGCSAIRNSDFGYVDIAYLLDCGGCGSSGLPPYTVTVVYESGLSTGTSTQPAVLQALTIAAQINLNEMDLSLSNEGTGDIGIESFSNQKYSEKRMKMGSSAFGNSAMANRAARLIRKYRSRPSVAFH